MIDVSKNNIDILTINTKTLELESLLNKKIKRNAFLPGG